MKLKNIKKIVKHNISVNYAIKAQKIDENITKIKYTNGSMLLESKCTTKEILEYNKDIDTFKNSNNVNISTEKGYPQRIIPEDKFTQVKPNEVKEKTNYKKMKINCQSLIDILSLLDEQYIEIYVSDNRNDPLIIKSDTFYGLQMGTRE